MTNNQDWKIPTGLSAKGRKAAFAIRNFAKANGLSFTGGCKVFYSPAEWKARGEQYCTTSELIVVYEGADLGLATSMDRAYDFGSYDLQEKLIDVLAEIGLYTEEATGWYGGVYKS